MLAATTGDESERFGAPASVIGVEIDRASGRRAVQIVTPAGTRVASQSV
jgi:hypothetical protein